MDTARAWLGIALALLAAVALLAAICWWWVGAWITNPTPVPRPGEILAGVAYALLLAVLIVLLFVW